MSLDRVHRRSVGYMEHAGRTWACFLVTFQGRDLRWRGYFSFRPTARRNQDGEVRTADIFLEATEAALDHKARGLGRPLLKGLLESALHLRDRERDASTALRRRFCSLLSENAMEMSSSAVGAARSADGASPLAGTDLSALRSLYASYRLDQVVHFIALLDPVDFEEAVDRILEGRKVDFRTRDRVQFAMMVVEYLEARLPLPPFEVWAQDYVEHREAYATYAHELHREGVLP